MACGQLVCLLSGSFLPGASWGVCFIGPRCLSPVGLRPGTLLIAGLPSGPPSISCHGTVCSFHMGRCTRAFLSQARMESNPTKPGIVQGLGIIGMCTGKALPSQILSSKPKSINGAGVGGR